jgi:hypothetical protein
LVSFPKGRTWIEDVSGRKIGKATTSTRLEKLQNDDLHCLYSPPNIIKVIESRTIEWAGHVACMAQEEHAPMTLAHKSGKDCLSDSRNTTFKALISAQRMRAAIRHRRGGGNW